MRGSHRRHVRRSGAWCYDMVTRRSKCSYCVMEPLGTTRTLPLVYSNRTVLGRLS